MTVPGEEFTEPPFLARRVPAKYLMPIPMFWYPVY